MKCEWCGAETEGGIGSTCKNPQCGPPAAGPWCYDVDSAPEGIPIIAIYRGYWCKAKRQGRVWSNDECLALITPIAYAKINIPEGI